MTLFRPPRSLSGRMARWGVLIVLLYAAAALLTPLLIQLSWLADPNAGLANPIYAPPSLAHWCGTDRLGRDVCVRSLAGSGVALQVVLVLGGLGFLGLGLPETIPEWGGDLQQALTAVPTGIWWTALDPELAMFLLVLGLSFLGEGLESWLSGAQRSAG